MHRGARTLSQRQVRKGSPMARFLFAPGARENPYGLFDEIRGLGRLVPTPLMHVTTDHAIISGALRDSQSFGVAFGDSAGVPLVVRMAFQAPDPEVASVVDPPSLLAV